MPKATEPPRRTGTSSTNFTKMITDIVDEAYDDRGEWYYVERSTGSPHNAHTSVLRMVGKKFAEVSVQGDRVYVRIRHDKDT